MRNKPFTQPTDPGVMQKSLRHNAREAAEYLTGIPYVPEYEIEDLPLRTAGRGASGESSN